MTEYHCPQLQLATREDSEITSNGKTTENKGGIDLQMSDPVVDQDKKPKKFFMAFNQVVTFLRPFVESIHTRAIQSDILFPQYQHTVSCILILIVYSGTFL